MSNSRKGPGSFDAWCKGWAVFKNAMLYLEEATVAALDGYRDHIQELSQTYPTCWFILYNADTRCRSEQLEHILRDASASVLTADEVGHKAVLIGYDGKKPWDYVFKQAVSETNSCQQAFWNKEVHLKCGQYLNRTASFAAIMGDGTTLQSPTNKGKRGAPKGGESEDGPPNKKPYNSYNKTRDRRAPGPTHHKGGKGKGQGQGSSYNGTQEWRRQGDNNEWHNQTGGGGWPQGGHSKSDKGGKGNKGDKGGKSNKGGKGDKGKQGGKASKG